MFLGVICGFLVAFLQPVSYLLSRRFFVHGGKTLELTIYSQVLMGVIAIAMLLCCWPAWSFDSDIASCTAWSMGTILIAQVCYFLAVRFVEPSRLASMLGLKIVFLALLNMLLFGEQLRPIHWLAVLLCGVAALIMNHSGFKISPKALAAIIVCCFFLAASDIADYRLVTAIKQENPILRGILATGFCYGGLGLISLPGLFFLRFDWRKCGAAIPYSSVWILAMVMFYLCVGLLGTVFTSIIQSLRGLVSVLLGAMVAWLGYADVESKGSAATWLLRLAAALLIMAAITIFTRNPL